MWMLKQQVRKHFKGETWRRMSSLCDRKVSHASLPNHFCHIFHMDDHVVESLQFSNKHNVDKTTTF